MLAPHGDSRGSTRGPEDSPGVHRDLLVYGHCDLHAHTTASDGTLSPKALAGYARHKGLTAIGVCDHDTISGVLSLYPPDIPIDTLDPLSVDRVEIVPGVEINSQWGGRELHILGYYVPIREGPFWRLLLDLQASRQDKTRLTVRRLEEMGMPVELSRVLELSAGDSIGRPHVAQAMVEKGYVSSVKEAFERYLGIGRPAYVERLHLGPRAAVRAIAGGGGIPVWAHPGTSHALNLIKGLVDDGLLGIEAFHPDHDRRMSDECLRLAAEYGLVVTGGSDFHGVSAGEGGDLGSAVVPYAVVSQLKSLASS